VGLKQRYLELLDELLRRRAVGEITDDDEEALSVAMNDCRRGMTDEEQAEVESLIAERKGTLGAAAAR
jgi:hypothetical protein